MNKTELIEELNKLCIDNSLFSIYEGEKPDSIILDTFHNRWKVYYFNERGESSRESFFKSEEEAHQYVLGMFKKGVVAWIN